ncbi:glutamate--cysteine ligase [Thiohalocapsa marina]|uniref:Glutamate--cysteine ligase n=1 Tax=Thiohalocapsa marina TaxID=424902 RepID=A0A5M8FNB5_9GAMM|nr:glutamate-cysteine ligase family protein [Thiohalocapsa marina]KAA6186277.1 glutamate--cysteine ligase [Thiohalocapsa marina]
MGQDIADSEFSPAHFAEFEARLRAETELLQSWFDERRFADTPREGGFELEAWLIDQRHMAPAPLIEPLLERRPDPLVVPELAQFNLEFNGTPLRLRGDALSRLATELEHTLERCRRAAAPLGARVGTIGILPTLRPEHLVIGRMTPRRRYRALNEQILRLRDGAPIRLGIYGEQPLTIEQRDVMLEAAATSFQIHLKMGADESARVFNASKILSAPMVALSANSPYLFGRELWHETRIPLFEQAVSVGGSPLRERVGFGIRYAERSVMECFRANVSRYPVILPQLMDDAPPHQLAHLRLHNGTIWRWNRPLIGFDASGNPSAGRPHLRLEHRVAAAAPTVADNVANAAFYFGAVHALATQPDAPEGHIRFQQARANFYLAAQYGLGAEIPWYTARRMPLSRLILERLLPLARQGLRDLAIDDAESAHWLGIIDQRARTRRTGSAWQRAWVARFGPDMALLTEAYLDKQATGRPVHEWTLD